MSHYDLYFDTQTGGGSRTGYGGVSHVYIGSPNQRGHGIGSFLGGLFRRIIPLLKQGAHTVGKEALRSGINIVNDIVESGVRPKEAFKMRLRESGQNLKHKAEEKINKLMRGSGYKASKVRKLMHSFSDSATRRNPQKKKRKKRSSRPAKKKKRVGCAKKKTTRRRRSTTSSKVIKRRKKGTATSRTVSDIFA